MTSAPPSSHDTARTILVVEDDDVLREIMIDFLARSGWIVTWCRDGRDALSSFRADPADIVLTDIVMPYMDGLAFVERIREFDLDTPIVILTGYATYEHCIAALRAGANDFIAKPFENRVFLSVLDRAYRARRGFAPSRQVRDFLTHTVEVKLPAASIRPNEKPGIVAELVRQVESGAEPAGYARRRLAIRSALSEALPAFLETLRGPDAALQVRAAYDPRECRVLIRIEGTGGEPVRMEERAEMLVRSFSDLAESGPNSLELCFFRPRPDRPEKGGA